MDNNTITLTEKETAQLNRFKEGMDEANFGWLHEMECFHGKTLSGIVSSLVKKGLIITMDDNEGPMTCHWIEVTKLGQSI